MPGLGNINSFPCRQNLVEVRFLRMEVGETFWDEDFQQAIRTKKRSEEFVMMGQVNFGSRQKKEFQRLKQSQAISWNTPGDITSTIGYFVFTHKEVKRVNYIPKKGDIIIGFADYTPPEGLELLVEEVRPESPLRGKILLYYVEVRENRDKR